MNLFRQLFSSFKTKSVTTETLSFCEQNLPEWDLSQWEWLWLERTKSPSLQRGTLFDSSIVSDRAAVWGLRSPSLLHPSPSSNGTGPDWEFGEVYISFPAAALEIVQVVSQLHTWLNWHSHGPASGSAHLWCCCVSYVIHVQQLVTIH